MMQSRNTGIGGEDHGNRLQIELRNCQGVLLEEIANKQIKQKDIALTYAMSIVSSESVDFEVVNAAIIDRWSKSGLNRIKNMAWKIINYAKNFGSSVTQSGTNTASGSRPRSGPLMYSAVILPSVNPTSPRPLANQYNSPPCNHSNSITSGNV